MYFFTFKRSLLTIGSQSEFFQRVQCRFNYPRGNNFSMIFPSVFKVSKGAKIRNRYNQVPHLTQDTNGKVRHHKREPRGSPFPAGDHKSHINRRAQRHSKHKTEQK